MKTKEICRKIIDLGAYGISTLSYALITDAPAEAGGPEEYGVAIRKTESGEETAVHRVTPVKAEAERLIDVLATNFVTPVSARDVIEDWLSR